jgi:hypothetical protein
MMISATYFTSTKIAYFGSGIHTQCGLLSLDKLVAEAKYEGVYENTQTRKLTTLGDQKISKAKKQHRQSMKNNLEEELKRAMRSMKFAKGKAEEVGTVPAKNAEDDIPWFMRDYMNANPFGNVHMALRIGTLIIENGVKQSVPPIHPFVRNLISSSK